MNRPLSVQAASSSILQFTGNASLISVYRRLSAYTKRFQGAKKLHSISARMCSQRYLETLSWKALRTFSPCLLQGFSICNASEKERFPLQMKTKYSQEPRWVQNDRRLQYTLRIAKGPSFQWHSDAYREESGRTSGDRKLGGGYFVPWWSQREQKCSKGIESGYEGHFQYI